MKLPGLSVCIPVFGDSVLARYAVESVLGVADEVIVFRDGQQPDRYWSMFLAYAAAHPKVRIIEDKTVQGFECRNLFMCEATRTLLHFMDADDVLNENYASEYQDALRLAEKQECAVCIRVQELHGDSGHIPSQNPQLFDTTHVVAYNLPALRFEKMRNDLNPLGYENLYGTRIVLYPSLRELVKVEELDYQAFDNQILDPIILHLAGIKENRLLAYRSVAYEYQLTARLVDVETFTLQGARGGEGNRERRLERIACDYLNSYGRSIPMVPEYGMMPEVLGQLRDVARCSRDDDFICGRDDSGWDDIYGC